MQYFAYGSNLDPSEMSSVCGDFEHVANAELRGYRLVFNRWSTKRSSHVADVIRDPNGSVWGVIYKIGPRCEAALDNKEGVAVGAYERTEVRVIDNQGTYHSCMTYTVSQKSDSGVPAATYLAPILSGAHHWRLPADYIHRLELMDRQVV